MVMFGLLYRPFPALATSKLAAVHFILYNLGAPLAQAHQTVALAAGGSLTVLSAWSHSSPIIPERIQRARGGTKAKAQVTSARRPGRWRQGRCARPRPIQAAASER